MVTLCHCSGTPWHWSQSPRTAPRSRRLRSAPHWWWESPQPWLPADTPPDPGRAQHSVSPDTSFLQSSSTRHHELLLRNSFTQKRTYFTNHSVPHVIDFFAMLPIRHQVQVICELDSFRQLLQDIDAESFAALLYVSPLISFVAVNREDTHKYSCWEKQRQHSSKIQQTVKQHFASLVSDHVFLNQGKNNPQDAFIALWCLQLLLILTELLGETQR